jgi:hypothetical protein
VAVVVVHLLLVMEPLVLRVDSQEVAVVVAVQDLLPMLVEQAVQAVQVKFVSGVLHKCISH